MRRPRDEGADARSLKALLESMRRDPMISGGLERARLMDAFRDVAESVLGRGGGTHCRAMQITTQSILVEVSDSIWAQRIQLSSRALLAALRDIGAPSGLVQIRTRTAPRRSRKKAPASWPISSSDRRCEQCGGTSTGARYCLACAAEADFWRMPPV